MSQPYHSSQLSNGWTLATTTLPQAQSTAIGVFIRVGSRHEGPTESGAAHFIEHLLFKGTDRRSAKDIVWEVEGSGGQINAYTTEDHTCYDARGPAELLPLLSDVLLDIVWNSTFPDEEVDRERSVIEEEIIMYRENPSDHVEDLATEALWSGHSLGRPILGSPESLATLNRERLLDFYHRYYHSGSHIISVAGPQSHAEVEALIETLFSKIARTPTTAPAQTERFDLSKATPAHCHETREIEQAHLSLCFHIPGMLSPQRQHYSLLSTLLGGTMSSRLFQELREKDALCYQVDSDLSLLNDTGSFDISLGADPELVDKALATIQRELRDLVENGPNESELNQTKRYLIGQSKIGYETTSSWMTWCGDCLLSYDNIRDPETARQTLAAITCAEIHQAAKSSFSMNRIATGSISAASHSPFSGFEV